MHASFRIKERSRSQVYPCFDCVKLVQDSLGVWKDVESSFTTVFMLWSCWRLFELQDGPKKHFSPLLRSCEACAHLFEGRDRSWKQFSPLWKSCEACTGQFEYQGGFRKHFSPSWSSYEALARIFLCQEVPWKQVLPLLRCNEACSRQFQCQERSRLRVWRL